MNRNLCIDPGEHSSCSNHEPFTSNPRRYAFFCEEFLVPASGWNEVAVASAELRSAFVQLEGVSRVVFLQPTTCCPRLTSDPIESDTR